MINKIHNGDVLEVMSQIPDASVDSVITSPPYWQLRDYGYPEQWGLEPTYQEYLEHLWALMDEIKRVLKPSGTAWINLGDTYARGARSKDGTEQSVSKREKGQAEPTAKPEYNGLDKCLLLIPHRFAIGCIDRGWVMRNDIIWAKRNGMPESVTDRFTKKHEYIFFMTKNPKYYFDLDGIRDRHTESTVNRYKTGWNGGIDRGYKDGPQSHIDKFSNNPEAKQKALESGKNPGTVSDFWDKKGKYGTIENESAHRQGMNANRGSNIIEKRPLLPSQEEFVSFIRARLPMQTLIESVDIKKTTIEHWYRKDAAGFSYPTVEHWNQIKQYLDNWDREFKDMERRMTYVEYETDDINKNSDRGKNPGTISDFWDITTNGSKEKHYASFNFKLIEKPIVSGSPENGVILDPFCGTGTTLVRALQLNRQVIGIDGSEEYCKIAEKNIKQELDQLKLF